MRAADTPFPSGWWGQELEGVRPRVGTYGRYKHQDLPALPLELHGDFGWLRRQRSFGSHINREKPAENKTALPLAVMDATARRVALPRELLLFLQSRELQHRVRSCTDCFLDLSPALIRSPTGDGFLLRFLADSQGCMFWYVYQRSDNPDHCVVASPDFHGAESEQWNDQASDPSEIVFCEESFESFICRFWLENEIWFCGYEKRPLFAEAQRYIDG